MTSENNSESNINDENQDNNNELYLNDTEINIDYEAWFKKEPAIKVIIIDIKSGIDNVDKQQKNIKKNVLNLAQTLEESNLCEADKISITIKTILKEEIKDKKISSRWIEKILSGEKKRKYEKNKANSSLSKKKKQTPLLVTDNSGKSFAITQDNTSTTDASEKKDSFYHYNDREEEPRELDFSNADLIRENKELKEAFEKTTTFHSANNLKEIQFPKEKSKELINALDKCNVSVFIGFNAKGIIESIEPDTNRDQIADEDTVNDNYTY
jgi:hypothetical protein